MSGEDEDTRRVGARADVPPWADAALSERLPILRAQGEGPHLEFKEQFPSNVRELGKEIAAFATSGGGTILVGVSDAGDLVGVPAASTPEGRDNLTQRLAGICSGTVKPAITPSVTFAIESNAPVLVIAVPEGSQPVYYCHHIPYGRHLTSSRPAEPHEVVDKVKEWLGEQIGGAPAERPAESAFISTLARLLADILLVQPEIEDRDVNPWIGEIHAQFRYSAEQLRELALSDIAASLGVVQQLRELAANAEAVADHEHYIGPESWEAFKTKLVGACELAARLREDLIEKPGITRRSALQMLEAFRAAVRRARDLASRADEFVEPGRLSELQDKGARIGEEILRLSLLGLEHVESLDVESIRQAARALHLVETERTFLDGGISLQKIVDTITSAVAQLEAIEAQGRS